METALPTYDYLGSPVTEFITFENNDYPKDAWFKLKIAINISWSYTTKFDRKCTWNGYRDTVHIMRKSVSDPLDEVPQYTNQFGWLEELGEMIPEQPRGLQIQFRTDNKLVAGETPVTLDIADVRVYPISWCEWIWGEDCPNDDEWCRCGWFYPDLDFTLDDEQCDASDYDEHCDGKCRWICGDGIVQYAWDHPDAGDPAQVPPFCSLMNWPEETCGWGTEECEWPMQLRENNCYCTHDCLEVCCEEDPITGEDFLDCTKLCGNGEIDIVRFSDECYCIEECDDGDKDSGDGCSST